MSQKTVPSTLTSEDASYFNLQKPINSQRYRVDGQDALRLQLNVGDRLIINSPDHAQGCEVLVIDDEGNPAPEQLSHQQPGPAIHIKSQLSGYGRSSSVLQEKLDQWGIRNQHLEQALYLDLVNEETIELEAKSRTTVLISAAGVDMAIDTQCPTTEVHIRIEWASPPEEHLPAPLAQPRSEIRITKATAESYEVKAGEWIQIIDVSGKQCSDFLAFDKNALSQGHELGLDATATRTIIGHSTPQPGLFSRYLGPDMQTMVELVQDTVGRHDSFMMACAPKYYEDSGYFGHISCSDNFNNALAAHGIKAKPAWPAINFFFNTAIEACGTVSMDEPWSRAGDYVLLQAKRDLLCASSACPDDIDPANGWNPTDIHVRIYSAEHSFPREIAYRITPKEPPRMTKTTGFHSSIEKHTKQLIEYRGYWVASHYEAWGAKAEYLACRERVAMIDLSPLRKFEVTGPDAEIFLQYALTRNVRRLAIGEISYSAICFETGGMLDDGTIFRLGEQAFRWICGDPYTGVWMRKVAQENNFKVSIRNSTDQIHNVAVQGPQSRKLLRKIIWTPECQVDMDNLAWFHFLIGRLEGPEGIPVMVSRTGYTGELGFEVWCHPDDAKAVWAAIWEEGQQYQISPLGFDALDMLRIEAGLIFADHEFCPETNPYEAGIGFTVPLKSKQDDFIGRNAISRQSPESRKVLMGLIFDESEIPFHGDTVYQDRMPVGVITSATSSPILGKTIALCRLAPEFAKPGTKLSIGKLDGHQKRLGAEVTSLPFYDPERKRVRS